MKKVAVTGIGIVAPPGATKDKFWSNLKSGASFISPITRFDPGAYPSHVAGQVSDMDTSHLSPRLLKKLDLFSVLALVASEEAFKDAAIDPRKEDPNRMGIFLGNALGGWLYAETELRDLYVQGRDGVSPYMASAWFPAAPQGQVSIHYGIKGYSKTVVADRASALMAVHYAAQVVTDGKLAFALAGATEAPVSPYALLCCSTEGSLSPGPYRPFDRERDGFVAGEGAAVLVLEEVESAKRRGAKIYGLITGFGTTCDGTDRILPDPEGRGLTRAIETALASAGYRPEGISYIAADGLGTQFGDASETEAIKKVFGERARSIPVSAPKSMFGHLLGAAGAVDLVITLLAMRDGIIPPTINYNSPDPDCDLDYVPNRCRIQKIDKAVVISRGRGGVNAVMTVERS